MITLQLSFTTLNIDIQKIGRDYNILVSGGELPHIGCTVLAVPRPSLDGSGRLSATASVINLTGHKDEAICRYLAEYVSAHTNSTTVCTGGIHVDGITKEQIQELLDTVSAELAYIEL